jgi:hypothetical protein
MRRRWPAIALAVLGGPASIVAASEPAIAAVHESDDDRPCDDAAKSNRKGDADSELCQPSLEATFSLLSAYVFRGINVFQEEHQDEQKWVAKPRIVWTDATSKLEIGYTAIYQLTGDTIW